jgi:hypothetical protein
MRSPTGEIRADSIKPTGEELVVYKRKFNLLFI